MARLPAAPTDGMDDALSPFHAYEALAREAGRLRHYLRIFKNWQSRRDVLQEEVLSHVVAPMRYAHQAIDAIIAAASGTSFVAFYRAAVGDQSANPGSEVPALLQALVDAGTAIKAAVPDLFVAGDDLQVVETVNAWGQRERQQIPLTAQQATDVVAAIDGVLALIVE